MVKETLSRHEKAVNSYEACWDGWPACESQGAKRLSFTAHVSSPILSVLASRRNLRGCRILGSIGMRAVAFPYSQTFLGIFLDHGFQARADWVVLFP